MFGRVKTYIKDKGLSPIRFIEHSTTGVIDIANSELLYKLDSFTDRLDYTITKFEKRIDLISIDIYDDDSYSWILLYINKISIDQLIRGTTIQYISLSDLNYISQQV